MAPPASSYTNLNRSTIETSFDDDASTSWSKEASKFAPLNAPTLWGIINAVLFLWSFLLVLEISDSVIVDGLHHQLEESHLYLVWNYGTTIVWCTEVILTVLARAEDNEHWKESWLVMMELVVAIYFTCDSIRMFRNWKRADSDYLDGELVDAIINMVAFFYHLVRYFLQRKFHQDYELVV